MNKSLWIESCDIKKFPKLEKEIETEVCIVGAGLTGITSAYYLSKLGKKVTVIEKNRIGQHTSGNTTAKITSQHDLFYKYLVDSIGVEKAKQYLEANEQAIKNIEEIVNEEGLDCDFEKQDAYVYTQDKNELEKIKDEVQVVQRLGLDAKFVEGEQLPLKCIISGNDHSKKEANEDKFNLKPILGAIKFPNQAAFNPTKYLNGLVNLIEAMGTNIYEDTKVFDVEKTSEGYIVITDEHKIKAKYVILATHYPIINSSGFYFMKMYQSISYLIAIDPGEEVFEGMYINSESPTVSFRTAKYNNKKILLIGGMDHKTGEKIDLSQKYLELEKIAKDIYPNCNILFRWNTEDCISLDKIPYIGEFSTAMPDMYVATGFKKWGMTSSNIAANIITDKILGRINAYEDVFNSKRLKPIKNYKELTNMVKEVTNSLIVTKIKRTDESLEDIKKGEGKIVEIDNFKVGVYKDNDGEIYAIKPTCTHLGCQLSWNNLDKTWDCPCHGSRFDYKGKNIYDPAVKNLDKIEID